LVPSTLPTAPRCLVCTNKRKSRGLCPKHYMQLRAQNYDVTKVDWYDLVKGSPAALALVTGTEVTQTVGASAALQTGPTSKEHDAWVAAYAHCQLKGESMDTLLNQLVVAWYESTFPALARGATLPTITVQHA
jgi:hypothetical protein